MKRVTGAQMKARADKENDLIDAQVGDAMATYERHAEALGAELLTKVRERLISDGMAAATISFDESNQEIVFTLHEPKKGEPS